MEAQKKRASIAPAIKVQDMQRSLDFYTKMVGFRATEQSVLENGVMVRASVGFDSTLIVLSLMNDDQTPPANEQAVKHKLGVGVEFCIRINEVRALNRLFAEATQRGATFVNKGETGFPQPRGFTVADPDGYEISFIGRTKSVSPPRPWLKALRSKRPNRVPYISIFNT